MLCVPAVSALVAHAAVLVLPLPESATAVHPAMAFDPSLNFTLPVGLLPVTLAVKLTLAPATDGLAELDTAVVVAPGAPELTTWERVELAEDALALSPA